MSVFILRTPVFTVDDNNNNNNLNGETSGNFDSIYVYLEVKPGEETYTSWLMDNV